MSDMKINGISTINNVMPDIKTKKSVISSTQKNNDNTIIANNTSAQPGMIDRNSQIQVLKQQIQTNEYKVDIDKLADKLSDLIILNL